MSSLGYVYGQYGVDPNGKKAASDLQAAITRAQYEDYQTRFLPYLNQLVGKTNATGTAESLAQAQTTLNESNQRANQMAFGLDARNMSRYGVQSNNAANDKRMMALGLAANNANTATQTMQNIVDRNQAVLSGGNLNPMGG